ncbi:Ornithine carbamoyltransferase, catabolic [Candidatus Portiera aleyrodidarum]|uniref:Ornithine carbamoyltransferase n=1 Tax=Candidatus Portiera aleyrodidarum TV TaxID=1297582 RepID=A0A8D4BNA9_9GAMM|nr:ornithine carbamoyltransferase [Candidatus Portiera aleyrodidarum]AGI27227.1 ornithine carbamoyltransferase [Candidatus Portiera aleyrodidarum TV]CEI59216.1 Ornithine carbamoyltransferase, catabolic [Candidatus Portiera aleyrodidarum]
MNLRNRNLLSLINHTKEEINYLINLASYLKKSKYIGNEYPRLKGKNIALIFEKSSTRTRCAFQIAANDQGANVTYIDSKSSQMGYKESIKDTAKVLGRMFDAIQYRGYSQKIIEELAKHSGIPVFNGLTNEFHPTQVLADVLTMLEHSNKSLNNIKYAYLGDARYNIGRSLLLIGAKMGMDIRIAAPKKLWPEEKFFILCNNIAKKNNAKILLVEDPYIAVKNVDFIYTDVWVSMGESEEVWCDRIKSLSKYQINKEIIKATNNYKVKVMHCLPSFHNNETLIIKNLLKNDFIKNKKKLVNGFEITDEIFESSYNISFDQVENRIHTIKSIMVATLS